MTSTDRELDALERIQQSRHPVHQRDLSRIIGLSLGMTNAILKRLAQQGLLQVRKVNNRNIQYVVSAKGMEEIAHRSYRYLKRTLKNVVYYKEAIDRLILDVEAQGYRRLVLVGNSDLDFIVEHLCHKHHFDFERSPTPPAEGAPANFLGSDRVKPFALYSENSRLPGPGESNCASLRLIFNNASEAEEILSRREKTEKASE